MLIMSKVSEMFLAFLDEKLPHEKSQKRDFKIMLSHQINYGKYVA